MKSTKIFETELAKFEQLIENFPWSSKEEYCDWVSQTFYFAKETTKLLSLAAAYSEMNSKLQFRFIDHAGEERAHEKLLMMDMKTLGGTVYDRGELPATSSLYQPQYYWIQQEDPKAFFGYIILLEGIGAKYGKRMYEAASTVHGRGAAHFLKVHAEDDVDHIEKAIAEVAQFDDASFNAVVQNFVHASACYEWMLSSIVKRAKATGSKAA